MTKKKIFFLSCGIGTAATWFLMVVGTIYPRNALLYLTFQWLSAPAFFVRGLAERWWFAPLCERAAREEPSYGVGLCAGRYDGGPLTGQENFVFLVGIIVNIICFGLIGLWIHWLWERRRKRKANEKT